MQRISLVSSLLVTLLLGAGNARADDEGEAKAHFLRGKVAYLEGKYEAAAAAFKAAAALRPSPILDYNLGRCHDKLGHAQEALQAYERYLAASPDAANRLEVQTRVAQLRQALPKTAPAPAPTPRDPYEDLERAPHPASRPAPAATPARPEELPHEAAVVGWPGQRQAAQPGVPPRAPRQPPPPPRRDEGPLYKQWWLWAAIGGGALITGFIIAVAASSHDRSAAGTQRTGLPIISF